MQSNYLLTTAENELGVVVAHSEAGESRRCLDPFVFVCVCARVRLWCRPSGVQMVPISWCEMQCPRTHNKEYRKVARVQPEYLQA